MIKITQSALIYIAIATIGMESAVEVNHAPIGECGDWIFFAVSVQITYNEKIFIAKASIGDVSVPETTAGGKCKITTDTGDIRISIG